jgi:type I restriction-modification system DNA methylase subunit
MGMPATNPHTKKMLCAETLLDDVGPQNETVSILISTLYSMLADTNNHKTTRLFEEWVKTFSQWHDQKALAGLTKMYPGEDCTRLLFCIHTYYALIVKLIAAETASLYGNDSRSWLAELKRESAVSINEFKETLKDVEEGILFEDLLQVTHFVEHDYFSWYLEEVDVTLMNLIVEIAQRLADYEYRTPVLQPVKTTDMFKTIYQALISAPVRHNLGEYYTPDWLAQFLLDRVRFTVDFFETAAGSHAEQPFHFRLLDPACGSGTFLVEALKRLRMYAEKNCAVDLLAEHVFENIVGIDANPLAVLAAKTNYLLHAGDLLRYTRGCTLPVYCADPLKYTTPSLFLFDYVVGNPPWVLWDNLSREFRKDKELWKEYGLFSLTASQARHGGGKKDLSMLFTYVCVDKYLKDSGIFGFFITQSVFKTKGAGEGFRKFTLHNTNLKVVEVHDFTDVNPFKAGNKTAALILKKGKKTVYPVRYVVWKPVSDQNRGADQKLYPVEMAAVPSDSANELSPWITVPLEAVAIVQKICGKARYSVHEGINSGGANGVYWVNILDVLPHPEKTCNAPRSIREILGTGREPHINELVVENVTQGMKKTVKKVRKRIEDFFVYPMIKSRNVKKWRIDGYGYTLQMQNPERRRGFDESWVAVNFPKTYAYLKEFEPVLLGRAAYKKYMNPRKAPFYSMYNIGVYTYAPYKVVWNRMGVRITACVVSTVDDEVLGEKLVLPDNVLAFIPTDTEDEAHYICSIMNSSITDMILRSIAGGTKSFGTPKIVEDTIRIPLYDRRNALHKTLSDLSKKAHESAQKGGDVDEIEKEIDDVVSDVYGLSEKDLQTVRKTLQIQEGRMPDGGEVPAGHE